jgi:hypothetical protein
LHFHFTVRSLAIGYFSGVLVSVLTIAWSIRQTRKASARLLLAGRATVDFGSLPDPKPGRLPKSGCASGPIMAAVLLLAAALLATLATQLGGEAQAGAFMGSGAASLAAALVVISARLRSAGRGRGAQGGFSLVGLAGRNAARNPGRSTLTIGLIAAASFLIVAVSAFRLDPTQEGTGGFDLVGQTSLPVYANLNSKAGRKEMLGDAAQTLEGGKVYSLRLAAGDDASCSNLYQASQPRVLGITREFAESFDFEGKQGFAWAGSAAQTIEERHNPWRLLLPRNETADAVPVVIDKNTAMYGLKLYRGIGEEFTKSYEGGEQIKFRVVGLLANSILQGSLLVGEEDFKRYFPRAAGYRYFLIQSPAGSSAKVEQVLEDKLSDQGFDAADTHRLLADLLAVQNTYLSTFQALGGLGLLLGTFGLAAVQVRSVLERRGELALLRAAGFRRFRLAQLVLCENVILLLAGLVTGVLAAIVAVLPHALAGGAGVPFAMLGATLGAVLFAGLISGSWAIRATLRAPLLAALRGE